MTRKTRQSKYLWGVGLFTLSMAMTGAFLTALSHHYTQATLNGWDAGNIISDEVMTDYNSMNEAQIQAFLKSKNPCNDTRLWLRKSNKATWSIRDGHFVCMADDSFGGESAAHIIWQAAQDYRINPKVLIVLLQKEAGLVTDTLPNSLNYRSATGYGCPDTAPCEAQYYGLKNQIRNAARFYRAYQDNNPRWYKPYWTGWKDVYWHPNANCGKSSINIQNKATASLYSYTPYRPNQAALRAGWGKGDNCSSYGNRNFYNYYTNWFGDTRIGPSHNKVKVEIESKLYRIASQNNFIKTIQVKNNNDIASGNRLNNFYDEFRIQKNSDQTFSIINTATKMALDVPSANAEYGQRIWQWEQNGTDAQKWIVLDNQNGSYSLVSKLNMDLVLSVSDDGNIKLDYYGSNQPSQMLRLIPIKPSVSNGDFSLRSAIREDLALDLAGNVLKNGNNIQVWQNNYTVAQRYIFSFDEMTGSYEIKKVGSNLNLDVASAKTSDGTNVQVWEQNHTLAQKWYIEKNNDGSYHLISLCNGKALDVNAGKASFGNNIQVWSRNSTVAQKWYIEQNGAGDKNYLRDGFYVIKAGVGDNQVVDIPGGSKNYGSLIQTYTKNGTGAQKFILNRNWDGSYRIKNPQSNLSLDLQAAKTRKGTGVQLWLDNSTCAQRWAVYKKQNGKFTIHSMCDLNKAVDIPGGLTSPSLKLQIWDHNMTKAQEWLFEPLR